jgi:hypothetical protein
MRKMINQTAEPLTIKRVDGGHLTIPALGEVRFENDEYEKKFAKSEIDNFENNNRLNVKKDEPTSAFLIAVGFDIWWIILGVIIGYAVNGFRESNIYWTIYFCGIVIIPLLGGIRSWQQQKKRSFMLILNQFFSLLFVFIIGVGVPIATMYFFGETIKAVQNDQSLISLPFLGRIIQLIIIIIASLLPALLFFLFDRQLMSTLRSEFYQHVLMIDPNLLTIHDVKSRYQNRVEEIYGGEEEIGGRLINDTRLPILVGTFLITMGWILTLPVIGSVVQINEAVDLHKYLIPNFSPLSYAFLGSYFFGINMVFRRYVRSDLRPKAYSHIAVRILITFILVWFFGALISASGQEATDGSQQFLISIAFIIGIMPETWLVIFREYTKGFFKIGGDIFRKIIKQSALMEEELPLTQLEGINLYNRARLMEEGVENIENLAHHDLIDLILRTRIPVPVLIDWVDQAILFLHTRTSPTEENKSALNILKSYGIRTATDLEHSYKLAEKRGEKNKFLNIIPAPKDSSKPVQVIRDALTDDEWMRSIKNWRKQHNILIGQNEQ